MQKKGPACEEKGRWKGISAKTEKEERTAAKKQGVGTEKARGKP